MSDFFLEDDVKLWKFIEIIARSSRQRAFVHSKGIFQECLRFFSSITVQVKRKRIPSATTRKKRHNRIVKIKAKLDIEETATPIEEKVKKSRIVM